MAIEFTKMRLIPSPLLLLLALLLLSCRSAPHVHQTITYLPGGCKPTIEVQHRVEDLAFAEDGTETIITGEQFKAWTSGMVVCADDWVKVTEERR